MNDILTTQADERTWKCALYLRLSKDDDDKAESDSITNQRELVTSYIRTISNVNIVSERVDDGYSGANFERPSFLKMMEDIKEGRVDCVAVKDLSRFGRNFTEAGKYLEQIFPFLGVRFISVNDCLDSMSGKSNSDRIIVPFKNLINDAYCRDISVKIRSQLEVKRQRGDFIGSFAAYGYMKDESNHNRLVVDPYAADIVRSIFKWKIEGHSHQWIADRLNDTGVLSPMEYKQSLGLKYFTPFRTNAKALWSAVAIGRILKDEVYIGVLAQGKQSTPNHKVKKVFSKPKEEWVRAFDSHEPIISKDDFDLANSLILRDMRVAPNEETVYLFSGVVRCADCGMNMVRKTVPRGSKKYIYYVCKNSKQKKCKSHSVSAKLLEESVTAALKSHINVILDTERILDFINTLPLKQEEVQRIDKQVVKLREDIARYRKLKLSLHESLMGGLIDEEEFAELKESYSRKCEEAEKAVLRLSGEIEKVLYNKGEKSIWIEQFKEYRNITELNRKIVVSLLDSILIHEDNRIEIIPKYKDKFESVRNFIESVSVLVPMNSQDLIMEAV